MVSLHASASLSATMHLPLGDLRYPAGSVSVRLHLPRDGKRSYLVAPTDGMQWSTNEATLRLRMPLAAPRAGRPSELRSSPVTPIPAWILTGSSIPDITKLNPQYGVGNDAERSILLRLATSKPLLRRFRQSE